MRLGACLSLTGRFARFGRQAARGLDAWRRLTGGALEIEIADDASDPDRLAAVLPALAARCDLLLGPYSTQLTRRAVDVIDGVLFNHGGAGDDVQALGPHRLVSVLAPASRYAAPFVRALATRETRAPLWVVRGPGAFGRQVAGGALAEAERLGLEAEEHAPELEAPPETWDLFSAGRFEDDVALVRRARAAARPPRAIGSIAAGVPDFAAAIGEPDGIYGIAQWHPGAGERPALGPAARDFLAAYGAVPAYPAVQAALWGAATGLDTTTLLGGFRIDPVTGAQTRHEPVLVRWRGGALYTGAAAWGAPEP